MKRIGYGRFTAIFLIMVLILSGCSIIRQEQKNIEINLNKADIKLNVAETEKLLLSDSQGNQIKNAEWSSDDSNIVTVRSTGTVTAISEGTAIITVEYKGKKCTCNVIVEKPEAFADNKMNGTGESDLTEQPEKTPDTVSPEVTPEPSDDITDVPEPPENVDGDEVEPTPTPEPEITDSNKTTLTLWCAATEYSSEMDSFEKAITELGEMYPDLEIEWKAYDSFVLEEKIKAAAAACELPDIFYIGGLETYRDATSFGGLYSLNDYYSEYSSELPENMLESFTMDGNVYVVPYSYNYTVMFANMDVLKKVGADAVPDNYQDLYSLEQKLMEAGIAPYGCSFRELWCANEFFETILINICGHKLVNDIFAGKSSWKNEDIYWSALDFEGLPSSKLVLQDSFFLTNEEVKQRFLNDECAFYINGSWNCSEFDVIGQGKIAVASYPNKSDIEEGFLHAGGPAGGLAVSSFSDNRELAAEVTFELSKLMSKYMYLDGSGLPAWIPDYDTEMVCTLTEAAAERGFETSGFTVWSDTAMDAVTYDDYFVIFEAFINGEIDASEFYLALTDKI